MNTDLRRKTMQAVKSQNTGPERILRQLVEELDVDYQQHQANLPGKPDLVFPDRKKIIFVHGCFWHGHDCKHGARRPKSHADYWEQKLCRNRERDAQEQRLLDAMGWSVLVVWECQLKDLEAVRARVQGFLLDKEG